MLVCQGDCKTAGASRTRRPDSAGRLTDGLPDVIGLGVVAVYQPAIPTCQKRARADEAADRTRSDRPGGGSPIGTASLARRLPVGGRIVAGTCAVAVIVDTGLRGRRTVVACAVIVPAPRSLAAGTRAITRQNPCREDHYQGTPHGILPTS
jgi:hypothetical protein